MTRTLGKTVLAVVGSTAILGLIVPSAQAGRGGFGRGGGGGGFRGGGGGRFVHAPSMSIPAAHSYHPAGGFNPAMHSAGGNTFNRVNPTTVNHVGPNSINRTVTGFNRNTGVHNFTRNTNVNNFTRN